MPANPEPSPATVNGRPPTLIGAPAGGAGFLDAPGLEPLELERAIGSAFATLADGCVLAVYNDHPDRRAAVRRTCAANGLALIATIDHPGGGTTFTLQDSR